MTRLIQLLVLSTTVALSSASTMAQPAEELKPAPVSSVRGTPPGDHLVRRPPIQPDQGERWHAGTWDSTVYNLFERPRTIALRVEVVESERRDPVAGAEVILKGRYKEELRGRIDDVVLPDVPRERDFRLHAVTGNDGIAVLALGWCKEYPWREGIDDIEKVQALEVWAPGYQLAASEYNFSRLFEFGQDRTTRMQDPGLFEQFEKAWTKEVDREDVTFCLMELGTHFKNYNKTSLDSPEFFDRIRSKDYGKVFTARRNMFTKGDPPQSLCGPYFIYQVNVLLDKAPVAVAITGSSVTPEQMQTGKSPIPASTLQDMVARADEHYGQQRYDDAFRLYRDAAQAGHGAAMNRLGWMYQHGFGTDTSYVEAATWYRRSAAVGCAEGMYNLGYLFQEGLGLTLDVRESVRWYRKAADAGNADAMFNLACAYQEGKGLQKDTEEAMRWLRRAADAGQEKAKQALENMER